MFHLDNNSGIDVMPEIKQTLSRQKKWFTEGDVQTPPSYPGADWFNIVQAELLNVLKDGNITPQKAQLNQLSDAIRNIITKNQQTVKLNSSTNSTSETEAATPLAVKKAYDLASNALKKGDYGIGSSTGAIAENFDDHLVGGFYQCRTTDFTDLQLAGNSTATLLAYPSNSTTWKVEQLSVVNSKEPRIYYRCDTKEGKQKWYECYTTANRELTGLIDKFTSGGVESRVYSNDKRFYLLVRDDGMVGMYNTVRKNLPWGFTEDGVLGEGYVPADRVLNLEQYIRNFTLPPGIPLPWPHDRPPAGWFECNGAQFDVNQFPRLGSVYHWGRLPDLRGEFIRGWDNGRGADPGRGIFSWQEDAIRNIWGSIFGTNDPAHGFIGDVVSTSGTFRVNGVGKKQSLPNQGGPTWGCEEIIFDPSIASPISHDNHPRNVAFMYIVKAE